MIHVVVAPNCCPNGHFEMERHCETKGCPWQKCKKCGFYGGRHIPAAGGHVWRDPTVKKKTK